MIILRNKNNEVFFFQDYETLRLDILLMNKKFNEQEYKDIENTGMYLDGFLVENTKTLIKLDNYRDEI